MHFDKKRGISLDKISKLSIVSFSSTIGIAFIGAVWAIYMNSFLHSASLVGFLSTALTVVAIISYIFFVPVVERNSKSKIFAISLILYIISYIIYAVSSSIWIIIFIAVVIIIAYTLRITSFGLILRDKSKDRDVSKNVGLIYTFANLAWLIGPLIAGILAEKFGIRSVFVFGAFFMLLSLLLFRNFGIKDDRHEKKTDDKFFKLLKDFFSSKNRIYIYIISGGITYWWAFIYIYMPIYIIEKSSNDIVLGFFLALVALPLIAGEYYFGKLTQKKGFKRIFFLGYLIVALASASAFFVPNLYIKLGVLVLASVGMAMIEPTTEAYFLKMVREQDRDKYYGPYNTSIDLNNLLSTGLVALFLLYFKFDYLFIFMAVSMMVFAILSMKIREIKG
jgi:MFS family permease